MLHFVANSAARVGGRNIHAVCRGRLWTYVEGLIVDLRDMLRAVGGGLHFFFWVTAVGMHLAVARHIV
jgi:hypothetical protein